MIIATVSKDMYRYEIHSLIKAFYPEEAVKVFVGEPDRRKYPEPVFIEVVFAPGQIEFALHPGAEPGREAGTDQKADPAIIKAVQAPDGAAFDEKGVQCKSALKHLLYDLLHAYTQVSLPWGELIGIRPTKIAMSRMLEGEGPEETANFLETEYRVSTRKAELAVQIAQRERQILADIHYRDGFSLYVGIPFCPTTCLYCSFTSFPLASWKERVDEYLDALDHEMAASAALMRGRILDTIYIGGGTPTTLMPAQLDRLMNMIHQYFDVGTVQELTVEAGRPDSITRDKLRVLRQAGVSRISVNPQSMLDDTLRRIGRGHTAEQTVEAFHMAREEGFDNINMDIILGLPQEREEHVKYTLDRISALAPDDLTVHSLAVKRGSRLQKWIETNGFSSIRNTDACVEMAAESARKMGMEPYYLYRQKNMSGNFENVGYAKPGCAGIYNILIMEEKQSILALGAGSISKGVFASGRIERSDNCKDVETYLENIDEMIERKQKLFG